MIKGIGTDIIELKRIKKATQNPRFLERYFTMKEKALFESKNSIITVVASNYAVKEAVSKVLGTGFREFGLSDIEVLRDSLGKPFVILYNEAKRRSEVLGIQHFHVTTSHNKETVVAFVIGE